MLFLKPSFEIVVMMLGAGSGDYTGFALSSKILSFRDTVLL